MAERLQAWLELATERLADKPVPLYLIPGNDDDFSIDEVLNRPQYAPVNVDGKVVDIPGGLQLLACGGRTTRRGTPRARRPRTSSTSGSTRSPARCRTPGARSS